MPKRAPSLASRLHRRSRRALAAFLLLSSSAIIGMAPPAAAHDHSPDRPDQSAALNAAQRHPASDLGGLVDWLAEDCWSVDSCFTGSCAESISAARPAVAKPGKTSVGGGGKAAAAASGGSGGARADAVGPAVDFQRIQELIAWGTGAAEWIAPRVMAADFASLAGAAPSEDNRRFGRDLSDLTCEEPVDVQAGMPRHTGRGIAGRPSATTGKAATLATKVTSQVVEPRASEPPQFGPIGLVGGSAVIATLSDAYLPYDLSPEDAIAMRMYPIAHPASSYLGARRTGMFAPVDGLADTLQWRVRTEPAVAIATRGVARSAEQQQADQLLASVAVRAVQATQPNSDVRAWLHPRQVAASLGELAYIGDRAARFAIQDAAVKLAAAWQPADRRRGDRLIVQAEQPEAQPARREMTPVSPTDRGRVLQVELACQAAIDVVLAQAARGAQSARPQADAVAALSLTAPLAHHHGDAVPASNEVARAEAVATVCDRAAASLERLAMAIRRAGDAAVRQAKVGATPDTRLR